MIGTYPLIVGKDGILEHMKQFMRMYNLATYIDKENFKIKSNPKKAAVAERMVEGYTLISKDKALDHYIKTYKVSKVEAEEVYRQALEKKYIYHYIWGTTVSSLEVTPGAGNDFIQKIGKFRIGMWADIQQRYTPYSTTISLIALSISIISIALTYTR